MNVFLRRKLWIAASLLVFLPCVHAASEGENAAPVAGIALPEAAAPAEAVAASESSVSEVVAAPSADMTILSDSENAADTTILPESKAAERRAKLLERRRQSEERMLSLLREVGGDVPQLREALRDHLQEEARARRPIRDVGRRLLSALNVSASYESAPTTQSIQKLRDALGLPVPLEAHQTLGGAEEIVPGAPNSSTLDAELRVSLRLQKNSASALAGNAFGLAAPHDLSPDAERVLAAKDEEELRVLVAQMRQMQAAERERRLAREAELDVKLHFRDNPRLEAALLLLGIIGDSGYTISIKPPPAARATPSQDAASTRETVDAQDEAAAPEKLQ